MSSSYDRTIRGDSAEHISAGSSPLLLDEERAQLPPGTMVAGRYRIDGYLGAGGMGTVYRAHDSKDAGAVALKLIREDDTDGKMVERFRREGELASAATHPNIVEVYDLGQADGSWYMTMELL